MKYIAVLFFSLIIFVGFVIRANFNAMFHSFFHKKDLKEEKKFQYKGLVITWIIFTVTAFIYVIFFVD